MDKESGHRQTWSVVNKCCIFHQWQEESHSVEKCPSAICPFQKDFPSFPSSNCLFLPFLSHFLSVFLDSLPSATASFHTFPPLLWLSALFSLAWIIPVHLHFTFYRILIAHMNLSAFNIWFLLNRINVHILHIIGTIRLSTISRGKIRRMHCSLTQSYTLFSSLSHVCVRVLLGTINNILVCQRI